MEFIVSLFDEARRDPEALLLEGEKYEVMDWKKGIFFFIGVLIEREVELERFKGGAFSGM